MSRSGALSKAAKWIVEQARAGDRRAEALLAWIGRTWRALVPARLRNPLERLGAALQLDARLVPAIVAVLLYPVVDRLGASWSLLLILVPVALWSDAICRRAITFRARMVTFLVFFAVILVVPVVVAPVFPREWERVGAISGYAFRIGLYALIAAGLVLALRIVLGPRRQSRIAVGLAGFGLGIVATFSAFIGQFPGWDLFDVPAQAVGADGWAGVAIDLLVVSVIAALLFLLSLTFELLSLGARLEVKAVPVATAIAWVLPAVFLYSAAMESIETEFPSRAVRDFDRGGQVSWRPGSLTPEELAGRMRPVFMLDRSERWPIESVDGYVADAVVEPLKGAATATPAAPGDVGKLPRSCAGDEENTAPDSICYLVTARCENVRPSCDKGRATSWPPGRLRQGTVYARVLIRGKPPQDGSPDVFLEPVPYPGLHALVQYWIFYRNDLWQADTGLGQATQRHEADWEQVTVGVSDSAPMFVAYSSHCGGEVAEWEDVQTRSVDGIVRPVVWVARGSHASYPDARPRVPDFTSCPRASESTRRLLSLLAFTANVRETLPTDYVQQEPGVKLVDARRQPMSLPARWSRTDRISIVNLFREAEVPPPRKRRPGSPLPPPSGPDTPTCKGMWRDPLAILACSPYWGDRSDCTPELDARRAGIPPGCI